MGGELVVTEDRISTYAGEELLMGNDKTGAQVLRPSTAMFGSRVQWESEPSSS